MDVNVSCNFSMDTVVNDDHIVMADVIAIVVCWQMLCLGFVTDVMAT